MCVKIRNLLDTCAREAFVKDVIFLTRLTREENDVVHWWVSSKTENENWKFSKMCLKKRKISNVLVKQTEKRKDWKIQKKNLFNRKISRKYFWIFHLILEAGKVFSSTMVLFCIVGSFFLISLCRVSLLQAFVLFYICFQNIFIITETLELSEIFWNWTLVSQHELIALSSLPFLHFLGVL